MAAPKRDGISSRWELVDVTKGAEIAGISLEKSVAAFFGGGIAPTQIGFGAVLV